MAEELPAPPTQPAYLDDKTAIERIQAIVANARTIWFAQIGFLAFIGLTLTSVRDLDFFSATATTQLPIVNIAILTTTFFWSAAWLAAILHTYFHVYLLKLWDVLAEAPPEIGGAPLGDRVFPWLVVDWALRSRPDRPMTPRPMDGFASAVTWLVIWLATPFMLAAFWWRSMPAHDARLTLAIGGALFFSLYSSLAAWHRARLTLDSPGAFQHRVGYSTNAAVFWFLMLGPVPAVTILSFGGAGWHHLPDALQPILDANWPSIERVRPPLAWADLVGAEIVEKPADWLGRETAERHFKIGWCSDRGLPPDACHDPVEPYHQAARAAWCAARSIDDCTEAFQRLDTGFAEEWKEQRSEYLANLAKPELAERDLRGASTTGAFLAGIDLRRARLEQADLRAAWLEGANLSEARLEGANLLGARLEAADLRMARLEEANLNAARLEGADLSGAGLDGANLHWARLQGANLHSAQLKGANLSSALLKRADLSRARLDGTNLRDGRLEGTYLGGTRLQGTDLRGAGLQSANWAGATITASPAHSADFSGGRNLTQSQFVEVIGDGDTILPLDAETGEQLYVWTCWAEPPPTLDGLLRHRPPEDHDDLRAEWLCDESRYPRPEGDQPRRTGRPAALAPGYPLAD